MTDERIVNESRLSEVAGGEQNESPEQINPGNLNPEDLGLNPAEFDKRYAYRKKQPGNNEDIFSRLPQ